MERSRSLCVICGAWACLIAACGCSKKGDPGPTVDLGFAVGAAAECGTLAPREAARPENARRATAEQRLASLLGGWLVASDPRGVGSLSVSPGFRLRVEVVREEAGPAVKASVEDADRRAVVTLAAARRGGDADPQIVISLPAVNDPELGFEIGSIDRRGRIALTACSERWSMPPVGDAGAAGAPRRPPSAATAESYFGGRPLAWWQDRLTELRQGGPPELYALAVKRAQAAGLTVEVRADGVAVSGPPEGIPR